MTSFKESGAIEYSSDVLIGLQYEGADYREGESENERKARIRMLIDQVKASTGEGKTVPIEAKILKNRNGRTGKVKLEFMPMFNYFKEIER
jgi:replicative DNA helicase